MKHKTAPRFASLLLAFLPLTSAPDSVPPLRELTHPDAMVIAHGQYFIQQGATVHRYSLTDRSYLGFFGRQGEGPGELQLVASVNPYLIVLPDAIWQVGMNKVIEYTPLGQFRREFRIPPFTNTIRPWGTSRFLVMKLDPGRIGRAELQVVITDTEFKVVKTIYSQALSARSGEIDLTLDGVFLAVLHDHLIIDQSPNGFRLGFYNQDGDLTGQIQKPLPPMPFSEALEKKALQRIRENREVRRVGWQKFSDMVKFVHGQHVPLIQDLLTDDRYIYVRLNGGNGRKRFMVFDTGGKALRTVEVPPPVETDFSNVLFGRPLRLFQFHQGRYHYLCEDEETGEWRILSMAPLLYTE